MHIIKHTLIVLGVMLFGYTGVVSASLITYDVTVNTSSITGTAGSLDFNFNPGPLVTQSASLQIGSFTSDGSLVGGPAITGNVVGALPAAVTFDNGTAFNDYFQGLTFGSDLQFKVSLYGPALSAPDGTSTSGSMFAFSMFADQAGTIPALTRDMANGFAFTVGVNPDGTTTLTNYSPVTSVLTPVPLPSSFVLAGSGLFILVATQYCRQRVRG